MFSTAVSKLDYPKASIRSGAALCLLYCTEAVRIGRRIVALVPCWSVGITGRTIRRIKRPEHSHRLRSALSG
jgi:hypothetical protein